jgi:YD repeat-containing protein
VIGTATAKSVTDPRGFRTTYAYDALRRLTSVTDALNEVTTTGYDANGFAQAVTDPLNHTTTTLYDVLGRVTATIDALGHRTTTTYDAAGLPLTSTDELGRQTSLVYDGYKRRLVAEAINALGTPRTPRDSSHWSFAWWPLRRYSPRNAPYPRGNHTLLQDS